MRSFLLVVATSWIVSGSSTAQVVCDGSNCPQSEAGSLGRDDILAFYFQLGVMNRYFADMQYRAIGFDPDKQKVCMDACDKQYKEQTGVCVNRYPPQADVENFDPVTANMLANCMSVMEGKHKACLGPYSASKCTPDF